MRISDWSSDVCSSDLLGGGDLGHALDRPRQLEVRAGLEDPCELAEAQHHAAFLLGAHHATVKGQTPHQRHADPAQRTDATAAAHATAVADTPAQSPAVTDRQTNGTRQSA